MSEARYKQYRRTQIAEMADWEPGFDMNAVSISAADANAGSPKLGDKIARNPVNHDDLWLVAKAYFEANFEPLQAGLASRQAPQEEIVIELARELYDRFVMGGWEPKDAYGQIREILGRRP